MESLRADFGDWDIEYLPHDGARISVLKYAGYDLLTSEPIDFRPPGKFSGEYETRPVYGYDDCFPTVDACTYPGAEFVCRDHGEICWQNWHTEVGANTLICSTDCWQPAVSFKRVLTFDQNRLTWRFELVNKSEVRCVFLHVMHALLPLRQITGFEIPECRKIIDEINSEETGLKSSSEVGEYLKAFHPGSFGMLLLKEITAGIMVLRFRSGVNLEINFNPVLFPTLGIWWNNGGYPAEGQRRTECAFEPIPGACSDLAKSFREGIYLSVEPGEKTCWEIIWTIRQDISVNDNKLCNV